MGVGARGVGCGAQPKEGVLALAFIPHIPFHAASNNGISVEPEAEGYLLIVLKANKEITLQLLSFSTS